MGRAARHTVQSLIILDMVGHIHPHQVSAQQLVLWLGNGQQLTVQCQLGREEGGCLTAGQAVVAVARRQARSVGVELIEAQPVLRETIPAGEQHPALDVDQRLQVVALVVADLVDIAPVRIHHVEHQGVLIVVFGLGRELGFAVVKQHRPVAALAGGAEQDAVIRQVLWADVLTCLGA